LRVLAEPFATCHLAVLVIDVINTEAPDNPDMARKESVVPALNKNNYEACLGSLASQVAPQSQRAAH